MQSASSTSGAPGIIKPKIKKNFWSFSKSCNKTPDIKVDKDELKKKLTPIQYRVTQEKFTERPFSGEYLKLKDNGMFGCIVCDEDLFSSTTKYESGCGWPAFYDTIDPNKIILKPDLSHVGPNLILLALKPDLVRTEVTCGHCGAHLGHIFDDGPKPTGKRYCINSASLKFKKAASANDVNSDHTVPPSCQKGVCPPPPAPSSCQTVKNTADIMIESLKSKSLKDVRLYTQEKSRNNNHSNTKCHVSETSDQNFEDDGCSLPLRFDMTRSREVTTDPKVQNNQPNVKQQAVDARQEFFRSTFSSESSSTSSFHPKK